jgi:hypothetical protein
MKSGKIAGALLISMGATLASTTAHADHLPLNVAFGAGAGALLGKSFGGRDGALVGGALGAVAGVALSSHRGGPAYAQPVYVQPAYVPQQVVYAPPPAVVYQQPRVVYAQPQVVYGPAPVYVTPAPVRYYRHDHHRGHHGWEREGREYRGWR